MLNKIFNVLDCASYVKTKRIDGVSYKIVTLLYYLEDSIVLYNRGELEYEKGDDVIIIIENEDFEYVMKGIVSNSGEDLHVIINKVDIVPNKREHKRFDVNVEVECMFNEQKSIINLINISRCGALVCSKREYKVGDELEIMLNGEKHFFEVVRQNPLNDIYYLGGRFKHACNVKSLLEGWNVLFHNEKGGVYVLLDNYEELHLYKKAVDYNTPISFFNANKNIELFVVNYMETNSKGIIIMDFNDEEKCKEILIKLEEYIEVNRFVVVVLPANASNKTIKFFEEKKVRIVIREFIENAIKGFLGELIK